MNISSKISITHECLTNKFKDFCVFVSLGKAFKNEN